MSDELGGGVAIVTGGASGIGRATALLLAQHGVRVFVGDYSPLVENERRFAEAGIVEVQCDMRRVEDVRRLVETAAEQGGRVDVLVNNAGIGMVKQIGDVSEEDWDNCLDTNLKGAFFAAKFAIGHMQRGGGGVIVNMASNAGILPRAHDPVYSISKGSLVALTKSLALCHAKDRIRVNCICPGPVEETRMMQEDLDKATDVEATKRQFIAASPLAAANKRMISPVEVAQAVLYLVSDAAAMVTGTAIAIDGGKSLGVPPRG